MKKFSTFNKGTKKKKKNHVEVAKICGKNKSVHETEEEKRNSC